ncbi:MAG: FAD-dependent oxidoreductase [Actinobacteria bacterium]|nr:FAD-dependent oxidoreductase [Actinomycetota bacterium]
MPERLVVIGGDAGGMGAASQARRGRPDLEIVALERGGRTSWSACGIPYLVGGEVDRLDDLVVRTPDEFRDRLHIDVRLHHEAVAVDLDRRQVEVRDHAASRTFRLGFDQLLFGTGARPRRPDLPGVERECVFGVQTLDDAEALLAHARDSGGSRVVVVGGGYIGLEMAEAFTQRGARVVVVEREPQVMGTLDADMGALVSEAMRRHDIDVRCGTATLGFDEGVVRTEAGDLPADLVVLGLGVVANSELAGDAGIALGAGGAVAVDERQATGAEGVWAAGDCCESTHLVTGAKVHVPLGTVANKQARVAGTNIAGGDARFPGVVGTAAVKLCGTEIARTGLSEKEATRAGLDHTAVRVESTTRAGYLREAPSLTVKMVAERGSGRLLGAQIVGGNGSAKRIDVVATALHAGMTAHQATQLDLAYAPPFSPVWDPVLIAARKAGEQAAAGGVRR